MMLCLVQAIAAVKAIVGCKTAISATALDNLTTVYSPHIPVVQRPLIKGRTSVRSNVMLPNFLIASLFAFDMKWTLHPLQIQRRLLHKGIHHPLLPRFLARFLARIVRVPVAEQMEV